MPPSSVIKLDSWSFQEPATMKLVNPPLQTDTISQIPSLNEETLSGLDADPEWYAGSDLVAGSGEQEGWLDGWMK